MKLTIKLLLIILLFVSCSTKKAEDKKEAILLADREAPLGWVYLRIFQDSTFEFESRGLRTSTVYPGKAEISKNQIVFNYKDSVPKAGNIAIYNKNSVLYTNGEYPERVGISMTKLDSSSYDIFSIPEIKQVIKEAIDLPELQQYFHIDSNPDRIPLKIVKSGIINKTTLMGLKKFNNSVSVINRVGADSMSTQNYLIISDWMNVKNKLRLQLYYPAEEITVSYMFKKDSNKWTIVYSEIMEE